MNHAISIRPSKDIRTNYAQISALTRENPVAITVNGKEDTVLLSHEDFTEQQNYISELEAKLAVYAHLAQAMDEADGLEYEAEDGPYGLSVLSVNGESAIYETDGAYWSFYVNGDYCNYGISEQPVMDGDTFQIIYTKA